MKYANTYIDKDGREIVLTVLPLDVVPLFDPENPQDNTYGVPDDVEVGWVRQADSSFVPYYDLPPTVEQLIKSYTDAIQQHLDAGANTKGYDNIGSASEYAAVPNEFQAESISFIVWRAACWSYGYAELDKVLVGTRPLPTIAEILAELPARVLP